MRLICPENYGPGFIVLMNCMERLISSCCHHAGNQFGNVEIPKSRAYNPLYYLIALEPGESLTPIHTAIEEQKKYLLPFSNLEI